jgi:DNA-binding LacI/PurR family transcriptional regulator
VQDWRVEFLRENEFPFVMIGRCGNTDGLSFIDMDFVLAVMEAYDHLTSLGHQHIGFLTYPDDWRIKGLGPAVRAMQGYENAVEKYRLASLYHECPLTVDRAYWVTKSLLKEDPRITAFVTMHTTLAVGVIAALQEMNRKVPDDCSIVSVPVGIESELIIPSLTGIEWSGHEIGHQAAKMLIRELNGTSPQPEQILVPPKLKLCHSTGPASR